MGTPWTYVYFLNLSLSSVIIRLEAELQSNVGFILQGDLAEFTRSAITPLKVNRFG